MSPLAMCGGTLAVADPRALLAEYLSGDYAWPAYDTLVTNGAPELVTGDLLAPALLDAPVDRPRFGALLEMMPSLAAVGELPPVGLAEADDATLAAVAELFAVLDGPRYRRSGVRGTVLSKVLHRKRPDLVPLYDSRIYAAYTVAEAVPRHAESWAAFMTALLAQMRADLRREAAAMADLVAAAADRGATLTPLRVLDILVWMSAHEA